MKCSQQICLHFMTALFSWYVLESIPIITMVSFVSWRLKLPSARPSGQQLVQAKNKESIKALHNRPIMRGICHSPVDFSHKWPVMRKMVPCHDYFCEWNCTKPNLPLNFNYKQKLPKFYRGCCDSNVILLYRTSLTYHNQKCILENSVAAASGYGLLHNRHQFIA